MKSQKFQTILKETTQKLDQKIKEGMVFLYRADDLPKKMARQFLGSDNWKVTSKDGLRTSHYEHCMAIVNGKAENFKQSVKFREKI